MAYDEFLADRIRGVLYDKNIRFEEKKMMGGLCFLIDDKMCTGIIRNRLMARIDPECYEEALALKGCRVMDFTGRPMKGYVFVDPEGIDEDEDLAFWLQRCLDFNPKAKSAKKKK